MRQKDCGDLSTHGRRKTSGRSHMFKSDGYASRTLGLLTGVAGSILLTARSTLTLGWIGFSYGVPCRKWICCRYWLGAASVYKIGCVFHRSLCEFTEKRDQKAVISSNI